MTEEQFFIDGRWTANGATLAIEDPSTGEQIGTLAAGGPADIDAAVLAADKAFHGAWGKTTAADRGRVLARMSKLVEAQVEDLAL